MQSPGTLAARPSSAQDSDGLEGGCYAADDEDADYNDADWERAVDFTEERVLGHNLVFLVQLAPEAATERFEGKLLDKLRSFKLLQPG